MNDTPMFFTAIRIPKPHFIENMELESKIAIFCKYGIG
jgi:hypothetical protein